MKRPTSNPVLVGFVILSELSASGLELKTGPLAIIAIVLNDNFVSTEPKGLPPNSDFSSFHIYMKK